MFLIQIPSEIKDERSDYPLCALTRTATLNQRAPTHDIGVGNVIPITVLSHITLQLYREISRRRISLCEDNARIRRRTAPVRSRST